jgi:hypothetical protein
MLIGFCGYARSGKDSAANYLVNNYGFAKVAFADGVREMAKGIDPYVHTVDSDGYGLNGRPHFMRYSEVLESAGYEEAKAMPDVRRLLQRCGTEGGRDVFGHQVWVERAMRIASEFPNVVISDVRFPNEAEAIKKAGGYVIRISRPGYGGNDPHPSEAQIASLRVDLDITATSLPELYEAVMNAYYDFNNRTEVISIGVTEKPRVYLAGSWKLIDVMGFYKRQLLDAGIEVVSGWTEREADEDSQLIRRQEAATLDYAEVQKANTLVIVNLMKSEGKACEMGMALALGHRVMLVGPRDTNVFYDLPQVEQFGSIEEVIRELTR